MKKFFGLAALLLASATVSFGQTVMGSKFFENMYLGINGGVITPLENKDIHPAVGLELGKDITPVLGLSLDGTVALNTKDDGHKLYYVVGDVKVNLSNWFGGYKGFPRRVEFLLVPGVGIGHNFAVDASGTYGDRNYLTVKTAGQINFNLGQKRAWFINLKGGVNWNEFGPAAIFNKKTSDIFATLGINYRFGSKRTGSHNFVLCPYSVTKEDYDKVVASRDALQAELNKKPKEVVKEVVKENRVEVPVYMPANSYVTFTIGSAVINPVEKIKLKNWVSNVPEENAITIVGSADSKTGSQAYNEKLAAKRAEAVKKIIVDECGKDASKVNVETKIDVVSELAAASRTAVMEVIK